MRGTTLRRTVAAAVAVPVLALSVAACSDDGGGDGKKGRGGEQQASGGDESEQVPPLDEKALRGALLRTGEVKGYRVQPSKKDALPPRNTLEADEAECAPVTDAVDSKPEQARTAYASGTVMKGDFSTGQSVQQVLLSAYAPGDAEKWLGELRGALEGDGCREFTGKSGTGEQARVRVEPDGGGGSADAGDDSVQFTMKDAKGKDAPTVFTVVRSGANTATFMSVSLSGKPVPVAKPVVDRQLAKLESAAEG
ncbi:hypothetical protein GCM10009801_01410 [Streptomyces albiaxialis]|uniref:Lipoprotein n=1 Tax=Streptomyces albiaxialis TaxID=329523 RepID=A0ABN2VDU8_9ACTN